MLKNIFLKLLNVISILIIVFAVFVLLNVVMTKQNEVPQIFGYSIMRVMSGSMEPIIKTNSMIVVKKIAPEDVKVGNIISFYSSDPTLEGSVNTHRVMAIEEDNGVLYFVTKGEANVIEDQYLASGNNLVGIVVYVSYPLGMLIRVISNPIVFIPVIAVPLFLMIILNLKNGFSAAKKMEDEEHEKAVREAIEEIRKRKKLEQENQNNSKDDNNI